ncbi:hypothetical protein ACFVTM_04345 [Arthrobacter sp. NPDC058130]|uniref:hypothetical protein n=1 Tax=Arthrobacter sp. NPDC058130 TaxID=3346353 RepID=UPI0036E6CD18
MKTKTAIALSVTGVLLSGTAAFAANTTQTPNSPTSNDDTRNVIVIDDSSAKSPVPAVTPANLTPKPGTKASATTGDVTNADDNPAVATNNAVLPAATGDDRGGQRNAPEVGDHNGRATTAPAQTAVGNGAAISAGPGKDRGTTRSSAETGDDKGGTRTAPEAGDDKGGTRTAPEAGDDKGGTRTAPEAGDDKGGTRTAPEAGDDSGGHGGHGSHGRDD